LGRPPGVVPLQNSVSCGDLVFSLRDHRRCWVCGAITRPRRLIWPSMLSARVPTPPLVPRSPADLRRTAPAHGPSKVIDKTARIHRRKTVTGLISEYHRAALRSLTITGNGAERRNGQGRPRRYVGRTRRREAPGRTNDGRTGGRRRRRRRRRAYEPRRAHPGPVRVRSPH
jgi:hypothetical protein